MTDASIADLIHAHVDAFNARDLDALMAGFTDDARWVTGRSSAQGRDELVELFTGAFEGLLPTLRLTSLVTGPGRAAAELVEEYSFEGKEFVDHIAGFYAVRDGRISSAKIYREGSADVS